MTSFVCVNYINSHEGTSVCQPNKLKIKMFVFKKMFNRNLFVFYVAGQREHLILFLLLRNCLKLSQLDDTELYAYYVSLSKKTLYS